MPVDLSDIGLAGDRHYNTMQQMKAQTRATVAAATGQEIANEQEQRTNQIEQEALAKLGAVAKGAPGSDGQQVITPSGDTSLGAPLEQLGSLMISAGGVKRGQEYLKAGVDIRSKESEMLNDVETRNKTRLDNIISTGDFFSRTVGTARNQSEWEYGLRQLEARPELVEIFGRDNFEALKKLDFDPNVVAFLNEKAMSAKERADLELKQQGDERADRNALDLANYRKAQLDISRGTLAVRQQEAQRKAKVDGTKSAVAPSEGALKAAETAVANLIFDGKVPGKDDLEYVAFKSGTQDIASQALQMVKDSKGLDFNTAIIRATIQSKTNGDWMTMTPEDDRGFIKKTLGIGEPEPVPNAKFRGRGMKAIDAVEMPKAKAELKKGMYYVTPRGVAQWDGSNFVKAE